MRWRRNCPSGSVEMTTDAHDLINVISSPVCAVLCLKLYSTSVRGESKCALCINCEKCVNGWENLASHCLCLDGMMPGGLSHHFVLPVTSTFLPSCLFWSGYPRKISQFLYCSGSLYSWSKISSAPLDWALNITPHIQESSHFILLHLFLGRSIHQLMESCRDVHNTTARMQSFPHVQCVLCL